MEFLKKLFAKEARTPIGWRKLDVDTFEYRYSVGPVKPGWFGWEAIYSPEAMNYD